MNKQFILGVIVGCLFLLIVAWVDSKYLRNVPQMRLNLERSIWFNYLVASAYELLFFCAGYLAATL